MTDTDTDYSQLPSHAGQKLLRIWLPGHFNKSRFVTDNSYIEMHDFFFSQSGSPSKCLSHFIAQGFLTPSCPAGLCRVSFTSTSSLESWHLTFQSTLLTWYPFSLPVLWEPFLSPVIFPRHHWQKLYFFQSPKDKESKFVNVRISGKGSLSVVGEDGCSSFVCKTFIELLGLQETQVCICLKPLCL